MAIVIYSIAFVGIRVGPQKSQNRSYLPFFVSICLTTGTLACELLLYILITPFWLLIINLCAILVEVLHRWYQQNFQPVYQVADLVLSMTYGTKEQEDGGVQIADHIV